MVYNTAAQQVKFDFSEWTFSKVKRTFSMYKGHTPLTEVSAF